MQATIADRILPTQQARHSIKNKVTRQSLYDTQLDLCHLNRKLVPVYNLTRFSKKLKNNNNNKGTQWSAYLHHTLADRQEQIGPNNFLKYHAMFRFWHFQW